MTYASPSVGDPVDLSSMIPGREEDPEGRYTSHSMMTSDLAPLQAGRTWFGRWVNPRMVGIIQLLSASRLMALPTEASFDTRITPGINQYLATATPPMPGKRLGCST